MLKQLEKAATLPTNRLGMRLFLQTMVRKSDRQDATRNEVDFENTVRTIPKERMKAHMSRQALDVLIALSGYPLH